jgi:hypothetical protein
LAEKTDAFWLAQRRQINNRAPQSNSIFASHAKWSCGQNAYTAGYCGK